MKKFMILHLGFEKPTPEIMAAWGKWFESIAERQDAPHRSAECLADPHLPAKADTDASRQADPTMNGGIDGR